MAAVRRLDADKGCPPHVTVAGPQQRDVSTWTLPCSIVVLLCPILGDSQRFPGWRRTKRPGFGGANAGRPAPAEGCIHLLDTLIRIMLARICRSGAALPLPRSAARLRTCASPRSHQLPVEETSSIAGVDIPLSRNVHGGAADAAPTQTAPPWSFASLPPSSWSSNALLMSG